MTSWVSRDSDLHLGVDRIFTSPTALAMYNNLLAAFEGASGAPTPAAKVSALTLIQRQQASNQAAVDFTTGFTSTYDAMLFILSGIVIGTDDQTLRMRVSIDGSTFVSSASYGWSLFGSQSGGAISPTGSGGDTALSVMVNMGTNTGEIGGGQLWWSHHANAAKYKTWNFEGVNYNASGAGLVQKSGGHYGATNAVVGIRFLSSSGNIASGNFSQYGIRIS